MQLEGDTGVGGPETKILVSQADALLRHSSSTPNIRAGMKQISSLPRG
jgi:hypothetical protein